MDFSPQIHFCPVVKFCICHDLRPFASVYSLIIVDGCVCFGVRRKKFTSSVLKSCLLIAVYTQGMFSAILFANGRRWMLWFPALRLPSRRRARTSKTVLLPRLSITAACLWPAQPARPVVYFVCWFPGLSLLGACPIHLHLPFWKALENQEEVSEKVGQACLAPVSPLDFRQRSRGFNLC